MGTRVSHIRDEYCIGEKRVAFACRRVATAEHTFRLLHLAAFDQRCYVNVISATSLSSTFRIDRLTIDTVFFSGVQTTRAARHH